MMLKKRLLFIEKMPTLNVSNLIVLDESGCHLNMTLSHARAYGGKRVKMPTAFVRGPKISIIGAISIYGVEAAMYGEWNTDADIFTAFIKKQLAPKLSPGKIIIMDNINFHSCSEAVNSIYSAGASIINLPPYSPELSPIENMWSKVKQILKKLEPRTLKSFSMGIKQAFHAVTKQDLLGWFKHCGYCVEQ